MCRVPALPTLPAGGLIVVPALEGRVLLGRAVNPVVNKTSVVENEVVGSEIVVAEAESVASEVVVRWERVVVVPAAALVDGIVGSGAGG